MLISWVFYMKFSLYKFDLCELIFTKSSSLIKNEILGKKQKKIWILIINLILTVINNIFFLQQCWPNSCKRLSLIKFFHFYFSGVVTNDGLLYVIGGDDGSSNLGSVECYDVKSNKWTLLPSCMMTGRSYAGVAVIDKPIM